MNHLFASLATISAGALLLTGTGVPQLMAPAIAAPMITEHTKQAPQRVVVLDFDYAATSNSNYYLSYWRQGSAAGISDLVVNALVGDSAYTVIDSSLVGERQGYVTDVARAVEIGRELGVDYVIIGSVTEFNVETESSGGSFLGIGASSRSTVANVGITARMISTSDGAVVQAMQGYGEASGRSSSGSFRGIGGGSSSSRENELLSEAVEDAVTMLVEDLTD
ncbi:MAG: CsgG/HfaB family protein [Elainellaceae cyanobacterium]|uniref:CsgG/HfaB family protein n=1 Tax=Leptolyngbya sp. CCY15150 TaxID=2767772 RepID=UPI00194EAA4C|nr:CsgG/HfaB family protein [Leptolyngbya sp. CCY15150]